jgi:hypothetical protein
MSGQAIRESVAALGVVASLVFVGLEIRQNTAVARGQARQELASLNQEFLVLLAQDTAFNTLWRRGWRDDSELTPGEASRAIFMVTMTLRRMENVFLQYREGLVDESALRGYGFNSVGNWCESNRFRDWWRDARGAYDAEFVALFEAECRMAP